jgi:hypothetical protein
MCCGAVRKVTEGCGRYEWMIGIRSDIQQITFREFLAEYLMNWVDVTSSDKP